MGVGLKAGETLLVHGGAGGIGTTAIQLGKAFGAKVIATDSPEERCAVCRDLGADRSIDYRQEDFVDAVRRWTEGAGVAAESSPCASSSAPGTTTSAPTTAIHALIRSPIHRA